MDDTVAEIFLQYGVDTYQTEFRYRFPKLFQNEKNLMV